MAHILVTGGSSYLGQHLVPLAEANHEVSYTFYHNDPLGLPFGHKLDIRDESAVQKLVAKMNPEIIIHTVGSNRPDDLTEIITRGTSNITQAAESVGARLIHISTDVVFNGRNAPYAESAPLTPIHEYGRAKAEAENIAGSHDNHVIVRTSLIYSLRMMDHGTAWMAEALRKGQPVTLFTNQRRNPVWVESLGQACLELAGNDYKGILHVAGTQELTRAQFGLRMLDWWGIKERESLSLAEGDDAIWPADCTFDLRRALELLRTPLPGVDEVIASERTK